MIRLGSLLALTALAATGYALAQTSVLVGGGYGRDCYDAVANPLTNPTRAERICTTALAANGASADNLVAILTNRGIARMRGGKITGALQDFRRAKGLAPEVGDIYANEGAALVMGKRFGDAIPVLEQAITLGSSNTHFSYYNIGLAKEELGDISGAYDAFSRASSLAPEWELAKQQLSRFRVELE